MSKAQIKDDQPGLGHNNPVKVEELNNYIKRVEKLNEDKAAVTADIAAVYAEAKGKGYNIKIMRYLVKERQVEPIERKARDELIELYAEALGMLYATPLGASAVSRAID